MGRVSKLADLIGVIKDKASQTKAALTSKPTTATLHLSLLRSTTHDPSSPPTYKHLSTLLSFGHSSRATASSVIESLMDRLQTTKSSSVALKCLIVAHHIIRSGSFILQDQLSVFPSTGGRNYLKLSDFRDNSSPITWELSSWVRWYGQYIENLLCTSRILGFYLCSSSSVSEKDKQEDLISSITNSELLKETDSLVNLLDGIYKRPDSLHLSGNKLVNEVTSLVGSDYSSAINEISFRIKEFHERLSYLRFGESVELVCTLKRLEDCKDKPLIFLPEKQSFIGEFWGLVKETKEMVGARKMYSEEAKLVMTTSRLAISKSARIGNLIASSDNSVGFGSARFGNNGVPFRVSY